MPGHIDPYCTRAGASEWRSEIRKDDVRRALEAAGIDAGIGLDGLAVASRTPSGRADRLRAGELAISATTFRFAIGRALGWDLVRSTRFDVRDAGDRLVFQGRGQGHGVGLCHAGSARMGEEGHRYRDILRFYFPGAEVHTAPAASRWRALGGERVEVLTTRPNDDGALPALADSLVREIEAAAPAPFPGRPRIRVYGSTAAFRDATGEPGWVAASTRGGVVRLQPARVLGDELRRTLKHELAHVWVESRARAGVPLWFREGLAQWLAEPGRTPAPAVAVEDAGLLQPRNRQELARAYAGAHARVRRLIDRHGDATVLGWLSAGLPQGT
jgi:stage II sporulation protein D